MTNGKVIIALGLVVAAVLIQTTVFQHIRPFGYAPALGLLTVIALARLLEPERSPAGSSRISSVVRRSVCGPARSPSWRSSR